MSSLLTKEEIDGKMSFLDVMRKYKPEITEKEANYILWNETCYPFSDEMTISQIHQFFTDQQSK